MEANAILTSPIHPLLVHFPIALFLFGVFFQILATFSKKRNLDLFASYLFVGGFLSGIVTFLAGKNDEDYAEEKFGKSVEPIIEQHEIMALLTLTLFGFLIILKLVPKVKFVRILIFILAIIGAGLISYTGHLGGQIVYGEMNAPLFEFDDDFFKFKDWFDF